MSNLKKEGFQMMDKKKGLDMAHLKAFFKQLAKFHAVGYHLLQETGVDTFAEVRKHLFRQNFMWSYKFDGCQSFMQSSKYLMLSNIYVILELFFII